MVYRTHLVVAMRIPVRRLLPAVVLLCIGINVATGALVARAEDQPVAPSAAEVREALGAFAKAVRSKDPTERVAAVRKVGILRHEKVAARLL